MSLEELLQTLPSEILEKPASLQDSDEEDESLEVISCFHYCKAKLCPLKFDLIVRICRTALNVEYLYFLMIILTTSEHFVILFFKS